MLFVGFVIACSSEPVLVALEASPEGETVEEKVVEAYSKPKGFLWTSPTLVEERGERHKVRWNCRWDAFKNRVEHGRDGIEFVLERGRIWVVEGDIQMVRVDLPYAMRRSQALENLGLPAQVREWFGNRRDWVTRHTAGFDRIRMGREEAESELVVWVEARKNPMGEDVEAFCFSVAHCAFNAVLPAISAWFAKPSPLVCSRSIRLHHRDVDRRS